MNGKWKKAAGGAVLALSLGLVAGGTWSTLTDSHTVASDFADGSFELAVLDESESINLGEFEPGDTKTKAFTLRNDGTVAMADIWMTAAAANFQDGGTVSELDSYLDEFYVTVTGDGAEVFGGTLGELLAEEIDLAGEGIVPAGNRAVELTITFADDAPAEFDGDSAVLNLHFKAVQGDGANLTTQ
ncbi:TasA family protein [Bacillus marinisedimentorum]|uniref:TasA family protein n=1 Tax=Bacillus marinisedimentorum TaxID=1821260 RepID=UPI0007E0261E|nr:TasA family protein [Bacillus marinisedimentorum]